MFWALGSVYNILPPLLIVFRNHMKKLLTKSSRAEIDKFLDKMAKSQIVKAPQGKGRLIFAMDATASRGPTWIQARDIQVEMFQATSAIGGLEIQLCHYRGIEEFHASSWLSNTNDLLREMNRVTCLGGYTQIRRVLDHGKKEAHGKKVNAMVFVGDNVEESADYLYGVSGKLGILGVPVFMFQEGFDVGAETVFKRIASLSRGAFCRFDASSAQQLKDLLSAVAVYAAAGPSALRDFSQMRGAAVLQLSRQMTNNKP